MLDFFIAGVQKGGTTALDALLRQEPDIRMASRKEAHFFDDETRDWKRPDYTQLHAFFPAKRTAAWGEATPIYSYWPRAIERIARYNPRARIILNLRHPTFRAYSHWRMEFARGTEKRPFREAISYSGRAVVRSAPAGAHRTLSYVERGFYEPQVAGILSVFPREQLLFIRTDRLWREPNEVLKDIRAFLGVMPSPRTVRSEYRVALDTRGLGPIPIAARRDLDALYRESIMGTAGLAGIDLRDWLDSDYREPMPALFGDLRSPNGREGAATSTAQRVDQFTR